LDKRIDLFIAGLVFLFGFFVFVGSFGIRPTGPVVDTIGPRGFPMVIGLIFMGGGLAVVFGRLRGWRREPGTLVETDGEPDEPGIPASGLQAWSLMGMALAYILSLSHLGYLIATPVFVGVALVMMKVRSVTTLAVTPVLYTAITYIVFRTVMGVQLPLGLLEQLARQAR
jgi:hypothetical protein